MAYVLAVSDSKNVSFLLEQDLLDAGHEVALVSNKVDALASLVVRLPDLIILDGTVADVDDAEFLKAIFCRNSTLPVILYSAHSEIKNLPRFVTAAQVLKSGDFTELNETVNRLLADWPAHG